MSKPSRALAFAALALLALPALAAPASAQTGQADLQVRLSVGVPRYLTATTITVTVENRGTRDFDTTQGWQIFVGWNGLGDGQCATRSEQATSTNANAPCYVRFPPGVLNAPIRVGDVVTRTISWTPRGADQRGDGLLWGAIMPLGLSSDSYRTNPADLPGEDPAGNSRSIPVLVHAPQVRVVPAREDAPGTTSRNAFWRWEDVTQDCLPANLTTTVGCRARPGSEARFAYTVHNLGTHTDSFIADYVYGSEADRDAVAAKGYRFRLSSEVVTLAPGASQTVDLYVAMPEAELRNQGLNLNGTADPSPAVWLRWYSRENPAVHTSATEHCTDQATCVDPALPTMVAGVVRGLNATSNETYRAVKSGHPATFNVRIENHGNDEDAYNVTLVPDRSDLNESWRPRVTSPGRVPAHAAANATLELLPPSEAVKGPYRFTLRVRSDGDATGQAVADVAFVADLQQRFGVLSALLPSSREVAPGEKATYALTVTNLGNGQDNATIALSNLTPGWDVTLADPVLALPPLGTATTQLNVTAPPGTAAGARSEVKVLVTSQGTNGDPGAPLEKAPEVAATALVLSRPNPEMTLDGPAKRFVDAGAGTDFVLQVRNVGNVASNFTLAPENPDPAWVVAATPGHLVLGPLEGGAITVRLRAPQDARVGETLRVVLTIRSTSDDRMRDQETIVGAVSGPDLAVKAILPNATSPYSGDPLALDVVLANEGNKAPATNVTLRVLFIQAGVERVVGERDLSASDLPGGRRFTERIVWDTAGVEGPGVLVARIDPGDAVREIDDSAASNEAGVVLTLRTFDVTVTPPQGLSGRPGEKLTYGEKPHVFLLRHRGNAATEPVRVLVESQNGWIDPERASLSMDLPRGAEVPIPLDVLIPFRPGAPSDLLRVTVIPTLRPHGAVSATVTTRVLDEEKPVIVSATATPARVKLNQNLTLEAVVRDATGVASVKAHLVSPTNDTSVLPMAFVGGERWALAQTFNVAGPYRFFVEAVDRAEPPNGNVSRNDLVEFFVDPGSAPTIRLADGQATTLRSGTPVRLNVTDPLGVGRAAYVIRGITYEMSRPYQIDTSSFPAGTVDVAVEAENVYGVKTTARFTLTIDNAPPGIRSVTLSPEDPDVNQDALLTVETDAKVESVDVLIRKDGRVLETRAAERKGPGVFELLLNPGEGDYVLDVTARDAAGNVKLQEGAVSFSARPGSPFEVPGAGLLLVALALVGAAMLSRRR
jgi:uncharacterized membrane protein